MQKTLMVYYQNYSPPRFFRLEGNQAKFDGLFLNVWEHPHEEEFYEKFWDEASGIKAAELSQNIDAQTKANLFKEYDYVIFVRAVF